MFHIGLGMPRYITDEAITKVPNCPLGKGIIEARNVYTPSKCLPTAERSQVAKLYVRGNRAYPWAEVDTRSLYRTYVLYPRHPPHLYSPALCTFISRCVTSKIDAQSVSASKDAVLQISNFQIGPLLANRLKKMPRGSHHFARPSASLAKM